MKPHKSERTTAGTKTSPKAQLDGFLVKFTPEIAARARRVLAKMRQRLPGAVELVYDNYNALAIGFSPSERVSEAIFSIAVFPRNVSLFFLQKGIALPDPSHRLEGSGKVVRHVKLKDAGELDDPAIR